MSKRVQWMVRGVNPELHKLYRLLYLEQYGTYNGVYTKWLLSDIIMVKRRVVEYFKDYDNDIFANLSGFLKDHTHVLKSGDVDNCRKEYYDELAILMPRDIRSDIKPYQADLGCTREYLGDIAMYLGLLDCNNLKKRLYE